MQTFRTLPILALLLLPVLAIPALAEQPTARVSGGNIAVRSGPGNGYATLGKLADGSRVTLDHCTRDDKWCFVTNMGWVNASYLVGWAAKTRVTQPTFMVNPFGSPRERNDYDDGFDW